MTANRAARETGQSLKSPLAAHSHGTSAGRVLFTEPESPVTRRAMSLRELTLADFGDYLRTTNNRNGRPYEETTVENYVYAGRALDAEPDAYGMTSKGRRAPLWKRSTVWAAADSRQGMGGGHKPAPRARPPSPTRTRVMSGYLASWPIFAPTPSPPQLASPQSGASASGRPSGSSAPPGPFSRKN